MYDATPKVFLVLVAVVLISLITASVLVIVEESTCQSFHKEILLMPVGKVLVPTEMNVCDN